MSYAEPLTIDTGTTQTLARVGAGINQGSFMTADGLVSVSVSHQYGKRTRRQFRVTVSKISADALIPSQNVKSSMSCYIVTDSPVNGFTSTEIKNALIGLATFMTASSGAAAVKFVGGES